MTVIRINSYMLSVYFTGLAISINNLLRMDIVYVLSDQFPRYIKFLGTIFYHPYNSNMSGLSL